MFNELVLQRILRLVILIQEYDSLRSDADGLLPIVFRYICPNSITSEHS